METLMRIALAKYIGEKCIYCHKIFRSVEELQERNITCAAKAPLMMFWACKECYEVALRKAGGKGK